MVEKDIKTIEDRASVCAVDTILEARDVEPYKKLKQQREELRKAMPPITP